ncbi:MAG: transposase [Proteobacteria bacterium]|nr:transposase [Pseudomonadota bacterium]
MSRSGLYYEPEADSVDELALMLRLDQLHLKFPFYGSRKLAELLRGEGHRINRKRVQRLMRRLGIETAPSARSPRWASTTWL